MQNIKTHTLHFQDFLVELDLILTVYQLNSSFLMA